VSLVTSVSATICHIKVSSYFYCRVHVERRVYDAELDVLVIAEFLVGFFSYNYCSGHSAVMYS